MIPWHIGVSIRGWRKSAAGCSPRCGGTGRESSGRAARESRRTPSRSNRDGRGYALKGRASSGQCLNRGCPYAADAQSRFDGYWERGLNSWDIAAGIVIVKESGGIICSLEKDMNPLLNGSILAASDKIYEEFSSLILT